MKTVEQLLLAIDVEVLEVEPIMVLVEWLGVELTVVVGDPLVVEAEVDDPLGGVVVGTSKGSSK